MATFSPFHKTFLTIFAPKNVSISRFFCMEAASFLCWAALYSVLRFRFLRLIQVEFDFGTKKVSKTQTVSTQLNLARAKNAVSNKLGSQQGCSGISPIRFKLNLAYFWRAVEALRVVN